MEERIKVIQARKRMDNDWLLRDVKESAQLISDYCKCTVCSDCPFAIKDETEEEVDCKLTNGVYFVPSEWDI